MQLRQSVVRNVTCGENVRIYEPANLYNCTLGDNVLSGHLLKSSGNTQIGADSKNSVAHLHLRICHPGARCFIGHGVMFANDMFREGNPTPTATVGEELRLATMSHRQWSDHSGGGHCLRWRGHRRRERVTKSITEKGVYAGNPAKLLRRL